MKMKVQDIENSFDRATRIKECEEVDNCEDDSYNSDHDAIRDSTSLRCG